MKKNKILLIAIFVVTLILIFPHLFSKKQKEMQTAFINKKYLENIFCFKLKNESSGDEIVFSNNSDFWVCSSESESYLISDTQKINDFFSELTKIRTVRKISEGKGKEKFGLDLENRITLSYYINSNNPLEDKLHFDIYFGYNDFSLSNRYFMTEQKEVIYETSSAQLDKFINGSMQFWAEPFIISRNIYKVYKKTDIQRIFLAEKTSENSTFSKSYFPSSDEFKKYSEILNMHHGGASSRDFVLYYLHKFKNSNESADKKIFLEMGDTSSFTLEFFPDKENGFVNIFCTYAYPKSLKKSDLVYAVKISEWTYEKLE